MVNEKELSLVKKLFKSIELEAQKEANCKLSIGDIFVQIDFEKGEVSIFSEQEDQLASTIIYNWVKPEYTTPSDMMIRTLNYAIRELELENFWDNDIFVQPLHISLVDKSFNVLEDLYFLDNDMVVLSEPLLKDLDKDLEDFLKNIMKS